jgi:peptidylprolyl isomerase
VRTVPLEIFYKKDAEPVYGITSDDDLRSTDAIALPFQAYGAVGMARSNDDVDSGSSQFFFLKWNQALNPPGRNTLDGFYTCFGYVTENEDLLKQVTPADKIVSAKVVSGLSNLVVP